MTQNTSKLRFKVLLPVLLTIYLDIAAFGILIPLVGLYGIHYQASALELTLLGGIYSLTQFVFAPIWGALSDRVGRRPILLVTLTGSIISFSLFGLAGSVTVLFLSRACGGIFAGNISVAQAFVADVSDDITRAQGMGLVGAAIGLGFVTGPPLGGIAVASYGLHAPGLIAAGLALFNLMLAIKLLPESKRERSKQPFSLANLAPINREAFASIQGRPFLLFLMMVMFTSTFAFSHMEHGFALLLQHKFSLSTTDAGFHTGMMLMCIGILGVIIQGGLIRRMVNRFGEAPLLWFGLAVTAIGMFAFPLGPSLSSMYVLGLLFAIGSGFSNPTIYSLISDSADSDQQGLTMGLTQSVGSLARALGPFSGLYAFTVLPILPFMIGGALYLLITAWGIPRLLRQPQHM